MSKAELNTSEYFLAEKIKKQAAKFQSNVYYLKRKNEIQEKSFDITVN